MGLKCHLAGLCLSIRTYCCFHFLLALLGSNLVLILPPFCCCLFLMALTIISITLTDMKSKKSSVLKSMLYSIRLIFMILELTKLSCTSWQTCIGHYPYGISIGLVHKLHVLELHSYCTALHIFYFVVLFIYEDFTKKDYIFFLDQGFYKEEISLERRYECVCVCVLVECWFDGDDHLFMKAPRFLFLFFKVCV